MNTNDLAIELDALLGRARSLYSTASRMEERGLLGSAARIPDELARAIPCIQACRNAAAYEAVGHTLEGITA